MPTRGTCCTSRRTAQSLTPRSWLSPAPGSIASWASICCTRASRPSRILTVTGYCSTRRRSSRRWASGCGRRWICGRSRRPRARRYVWSRRLLSARGMSGCSGRWRGMRSRGRCESPKVGVLSRKGTGSISEWCLSPFFGHPEWVLSPSSPAERRLSALQPRRLACRRPGSSGRPARHHPLQLQRVETLSQPPRLRCAVFRSARVPFGATRLNYQALSLRIDLQEGMDFVAGGDAPGGQLDVWPGGLCLLPRGGSVEGHGGGALGERPRPERLPLPVLLVHTL